MVSFLSNTGKHLVLLAITGVDDVMTLFTGDTDGNVVLHVSALAHYHAPSIAYRGRFEMTVLKAERQRSWSALAMISRPPTLQLCITPGGLLRTHKVSMERHRKKLRLSMTVMSRRKSGLRTGMMD